MSPSRTTILDPGKQARERNGNLSAIDNRRKPMLCCYLDKQGFFGGTKPPSPPKGRCSDREADPVVTHRNADRSRRFIDQCRVRTCLA